MPTTAQSTEPDSLELREILAMDGPHSAKPWQSLLECGSDRNYQALRCHRWRVASVLAIRQHQQVQAVREFEVRSRVRGCWMGHGI
jgi:hypothetical protein